jgi:hypothetical protein
MPAERNRRKTTRKGLGYPAIIVIGAERRRCLVRDVSQGGARIDVNGAADVPDEFSLCLSASGPPCRRCRVAWRAERRLGVEWIGTISRTACESRTCAFTCPPPAAADELQDAMST